MILPVKYPIITSFPPYANNYSILAAKSESLEWIYNNFIELEAFEFNNGILIRFTDTLFDCPFLSLSMIERKFVKDDILDYFKKLIDNQYYITVHINQYYLSNSDRYRLGTYVHPVFIYGYKDNMFNVGDFFINNKYSFELASFEEIIEAYNHLKKNDYVMHLNGYPDHIKLSKYINNIKVKLDSGLIKKNLINYMSSKGVKKNNRPDNTCFGLSIYDLLAEYLAHQIEEKRKIDIRTIHILYDQKNLMYKRIKYMFELGFTNLYQLVEESKKLLTKTLLFRNKAIKCNLSNNSNFKDFNRLINDVKKNEKEFICRMIDEL